MPLKVLVFGAGAIGCFVGGHLAAGGQEVTLLGRASLMDKVNQAGLQLHWPEQPPKTVLPKTTTNLEALTPPYDFILVTTKSQGTAQIIEQLQAMPELLEKAYLVSLQNGIGNEELLADAFGQDKVIAGTVTIPIQVPELGIIEVSKAKGGLGVAPMGQGQPVDQLADALNQAGLTTETYTDYRAMKWSKLLLNIVTNASSAILDQSPAQIVENQALFDMEIWALQEGVRVMQAQNIPGVKLPGYPVDLLFRLIGANWLPLALKRAILRPSMVSGRGSKMPSLHIDVAEGRTSSEVTTLNGAIVEAGRKSNIPTPVNEVLTTTLLDLVTKKISRETFQHQPDELLARLK